MLEMITVRRVALAFGLACIASRAGAQGAVTGQVSLVERPGEESEDLGDVVVWLEPAGGARARTSPVNATIQLERRQFSPRVRAVTEGSRVDFPNLDSFSHNVFSKTPDGAFDTGVFARNKTKDQTFRNAGIFTIYCNIHPRMTGYVLVLRTPYYSQAGADGRFAVAGVPAGSYVMHVWHDRVSQEVTKPVTVSAGGLAVGRVDMDARGYHFVQHKNKFGQEYTKGRDRY